MKSPSPAVEQPTNGEAGSLQRGLAVLELLARRPQGATLREITDELGVPGASALRIARTLVELGYLSREEGSKRFFLTNSLLMLGQPATTSRGLSECAIAGMRRIRQITGETTQLCCLIGAEVVILDQLLSIHPFKYSADLGARCPCYSSAPGKVLLAFLPPDEADAIVERIQFKRFTAQTVTSRKAFRAELEEVRRTGFGLDRAEGLDGIHCVAAPILDRHRVAVGAITIAGPSSRVPESRFSELGEIVRAGAELASTEFCRH